MSVKISALSHMRWLYVSISQTSGERKKRLGIYERARKHVYDVLLMFSGPSIIQPAGYENSSNVVPFIMKEPWGSSDK